MGTLSCIIVGLLAVVYICFMAVLICCHVHLIREERRLKRIHASYFKQ